MRPERRLSTQSALPRPAARRITRRRDRTRAQCTCGRVFRNRPARVSAHGRPAHLHAGRAEYRMPSGDPWAHLRHRARIPGSRETRSGFAACAPRRRHRSDACRPHSQSVRHGTLTMTVLPGKSAQPPHCCGAAQALGFDSRPSRNRTPADCGDFRRISGLCVAYPHGMTDLQQLGHGHCSNRAFSLRRQVALR
jgi:hypothetical protein